MLTNKENVKKYVCPACFAKELDVCEMHYDENDREYYCTKCAYVGKEEDIENFFAVYKSQRYKELHHAHPAQKKGKRAEICWPEGVAHTRRIQAWLNGVPQEVLETESSYFIPTISEGKGEIVLQFAAETGDMKISPSRLSLSAEKKGTEYHIKLEKPQHLFLEAEGLDKEILWYGNPRKDYPKKEEVTYYYEAGEVYEVGTICLKSNESVYIEPGAVIRGRIHTEKYAENIHIFGYGILDAGFYTDSNSRTILLDCCKNVCIEDITIIHTPSWHMLAAGCDGVKIQNVKEIGEVCGSDGVDIVGSKNVLVTECMLRNNDDCVAIKAFEGGYCDGDGEIVGEQRLSYWNQPISDILVEKCIFLNETCGNGIEIGHELQIEEAGNITFRDIDIVRSEGFGAAISIHAGDRALVRDIVFENIRIENYSDFLFDVRVMKSRFNKDKERGHINGVLFKDIYVNHRSDHLGYTVSIIGGWDESHKAENIVFENLYLGTKKICHADDLELFMRHTENIVFR